MTDYDIEIEFLSAKKRIEGLMKENCFANALKENEYLNSINQHDTVPHFYYDVQEFISLDINQPENLNIFLLNISSLPKHAGDLVCLLNSLEAKCHIIVLNENGRSNIVSIDV